MYSGFNHLLHNMDNEANMNNLKSIPASYELATLGGGCFWCTEAVYAEIKGVIKVIPGYSGGSFVNPSYDDVCTGKTGHAEVVQIIYDPDSISYDELLFIFFSVHDPTTLNRQGADIGTQYRSVIFYHNNSLVSG